MLIAASSAFADPPTRAARISFVSGTVSFRTSEATDWSSAVLNYPVTAGDHLWTDGTGRLELQLGPAAVGLDNFTAVSVLNLDDRITQLRLTQGSVIARVRELSEDDAIEIDTPNGAVSLLRPGVYRVDVAATGDSTTVTVRRGDAEVAAATASFPVHPGQSAVLTGLQNPMSDVRAAIRLDEFDDWAMYRERRLDTLQTVRYVPRQVVGYEDLDEFGTWRVVASYGPIWVPHVRAEWVPYRFGHWAWVAPWGWTWVDDAPWGFAPFHYGRWVYLNDGWGWVPGALVARPVYAPALVAFIGGPNWRVGVNISEPIGWFPLGPREPFIPDYRVSTGYVSAINRPHVAVTNVTVTNINITNIHYVNRDVAGAVTVVSGKTFVEGRRVTSTALLEPLTLRAATVVGHTAPAEHVALPAARLAAAVVAAPPAAATARSVVVRTAPAPQVSAPVVRAQAASRPSMAAAAAAPAPVAIPPPVNAKTAAPNRGAADIVVRHSQERTDIEARHAAERAELDARHHTEAARPGTQQEQAQTRVSHERERLAMEERQKREHEQLQRHQDEERRRPRS
jgi:hypothetical protein